MSSQSLGKSGKLRKKPVREDHLATAHANVLLAMHGLGPNGRPFRQERRAKAGDILGKNFQHIGVADVLPARTTTLYDLMS